MVRNRKELRNWPTPVRMLCVRAINLVPKEEAEQLSMFTDVTALERKEKLQDAIEDVRERYGKGALTYAVLMGNLHMPDDGREKVRMPNIMYQ